MTIILAAEAVETLPAIGKELGAHFFGRNCFCITTAGVPYQDTPWIDAEQECLRQLGATILSVDLTNRSHEDVERDLRTSEIIFVHGGNTFYLLQEMQRVGFKGILGRFLESGRHYVGSSAGSLVMGPRIDIISSTDDPSKASAVDSEKALGFIDVVPLVHFNVASYWPAFRASFDRAIELGVNVIPLRNDQYLMVQGKSMQLMAVR